MAYETIELNERFDGRVLEIRLGPPPGNIINSRLTEELEDALAAAENDPRRKLLVITGQGKHFSYGASVEEHLPDAVGDMLPRFHRLLGHVLACPVPTLARVTGACLGGGLELVLACGLLFCEENAAFAVPEIQLGVFPPAASVLLPPRCGAAVAYEMAVTGRRIDGTRAHAAGIANRVAPAGELDALIDAFVEKEILPKSASSLRFASQAARAAAREAYDRHIGTVETLYLEGLMATADAVEGIQAFVEKREPKWRDA